MFAKSHGLISLRLRRARLTLPPPASVAPTSLEVSVFMVGLSYEARHALSYTRCMKQSFPSSRDSPSIPLGRSHCLARSCLLFWRHARENSSHYPSSALRQLAIHYLWLFRVVLYKISRSPPFLQALLSALNQLKLPQQMLWWCCQHSSAITL